MARPDRPDPPVLGVTPPPDCALHVHEQLPCRKCEKETRRERIYVASGLLLITLVTIYFLTQ